jgi:hypothetical protein
MGKPRWWGWSALGVLATFAGLLVCLVAPLIYVSEMLSRGMNSEKEFDTFVFWATILVPVFFAAFGAMVSLVSKLILKLTRSRNGQ